MTDSSPDFILVSWTTPFSLDITDSDADLWYSLSILTPTSGSLLPFPCSDCHHISHTFYNLSMSGLTQGVYEIQVVSVNAYSSSSQLSKIPLYVRITEAESGHHVSCSDFTFTDHFSRFAFKFHLHVPSSYSRFKFTFTIHARVFAFVISHPSLRRRSFEGCSQSASPSSLAGWRSARSHEVWLRLVDQSH